MRLEGDFPVIDGDEVLLRRAFGNLFRNSLEACESIGMPPQVQVRGDVVNDVAELTIEDNGPGFTPEALARAFQPFATTKANGTGLGLAIVQKVMVSHNGTVGVTNSPEGGARFSVRLPR